MKINRKNDLSLRLLEIFGALMAERTTVGAAEALGISQPAVSNAIRKLEQQTNLSLFERSRRNLVPTEEALILMAEIEPLFATLGEVERSVRDLKSATIGSLRILATPPLGHTVLPLSLQSFLVGRSKIKVRYDIRRLTRVVDEVRSGKAEVGFMLGMVRDDHLHSIPLFDGPLVCVLPKDHPLSDCETITPAELQGQTFIGVESNIGALVHTAFIETGIPYDPEMEVRYCHTACVLANAGVGATVVDSFSARFISSNEVSVRPFLPQMNIPAIAIHRRGTPLSAMAKGFIDETRAQLTGKE